MPEIRSAQLYSVSYYGASGSSLPAGVNEGRLKKPRLRKWSFLHLIIALLLQPR
jgi:hypothetical protein